MLPMLGSGTTFNLAPKQPSLCLDCTAATPAQFISFPLRTWKTSAPAHDSGLEPNRKYIRPREGGTNTNTFGNKDLLTWAGREVKGKTPQGRLHCNELQGSVSLTTWSSQPAENTKPALKPTQLSYQQKSNGTATPTLFNSILNLPNECCDPSVQFLM